MGEARKRGTPEERKAAALEKKDEARMTEPLARQVGHDQGRRALYPSNECGAKNRIPQRPVMTSAIVAAVLAAGMATMATPAPRGKHDSQEKA